MAQRRTGLKQTLGTHPVGQVFSGARPRTPGCYLLKGAVESEIAKLPATFREMLLTATHECLNRSIDHDSAGPMEKKNVEGYY